MVSMMELPSHASMPMLISVLSRAEEFSGVCLRRSEKKALNSINKNKESTRYFVPEPSKPSKPKERIKTAAEKIFVLVFSGGYTCIIFPIECWKSGLMSMIRCR